jgi:copper resistance protein D
VEALESALAAAAGTALDLNFACLVGAAALQPVLGLPVARRWLNLGLLLCLLAYLIDTALAMTAAPAAQWRSATQLVLLHTHFGAMWALAALGWLGATLATEYRAAPGRGRAAAAVIAGSLALFAWARAAMGHAASLGLLSLGVAVHALHFLATALWVGVVSIAVFALQLQASREPAALLRFARRLSNAAALALALAVISGALDLLRMIGGDPAALAGSYLHLLLAKLALVGAAATLGAYNRWRNLPRLRNAIERTLPAFRQVLLLEWCLLIAALALATRLAATMPLETHLGSG